LALGSRTEIDPTFTADNLETALPLEGSWPNYREDISVAYHPGTIESAGPNAPTSVYLQTLGKHSGSSMNIPHRFRGSVIRYPV
jgi:hypothetical protein